MAMNPRLLRPLASLPLKVDWLVVAGGGGGGNQRGGGGGGGGVLQGLGFAAEGGASYLLTVGAGGAASASLGAAGADGGGSAFAANAAVGGGGGGTFSAAGRSGGSGGGGGGSTTSRLGGAGTAGQGFKGGNNNTSYPVAGAGGGGAGEAAADVSGELATNGGNGILSSITGTPTYYAGGGGGGGGASLSAVAGTGGLGGGGNGASFQTSDDADDALPNTGGGGGGAGSPANVGRGGDGGSGVVILRYPKRFSITVSPSLTYSTSVVGEYRIAKFTAGTGYIAWKAPQVSNAEAQDWVNRVYANGGTVSTSTASAVSTFCDAIEAAGIRDRFYRLGIFAGSNLNAALVPLYRNRAAYAGRNIITASENYLGSSYVYSRLTPTSDGVGPTGAPALKMTETVDTGVHLWRTNYSIPITVGATYTWSVYVKDVTNGLIVMRDNASRICLFDVSAQSVAASAGGATGSIADAGGGWYRLSMQFTSTSNPGEFSVSGAPDGHSTASIPSYAGDTGHSFTFSSPQLELGTLSAYDPTPLGNATDTNNGPFVSGDYVESVGLTKNVAATKYLDTGLAPEDLASLATGHVASYRGAGAAANQAIIGVRDSGGTHYYEIFKRGDSRHHAAWGGTSIALPATEAAHEDAGLLLVSRTSATSLTLYRDGVSIGTQAASIVPAGTDRNWFVFALNTGSPTSLWAIDIPLMAYSIGDGLDAGEAATFNSAMQTLQSSLGRA